MSTAKNILLTGAAGAAIVTGALVVSHQPKLDSKPGYQVEAQGDGHYTVFTTKDGSKVIMGKDLTSEQADNFLNKKLNRHNP